jgi:3D (Asp-Asp-Asp) domain-containing protein
MLHPELKPLVWGRHLQRLLAVCVPIRSTPEPPPRVGKAIPIWFQRLGAALTLLGLVGGFRLVDRALSPHPRPPIEEADIGPVDAQAWNDWAAMLHLRLNPFPLGGRGSVAATWVTGPADVLPPSSAGLATGSSADPLDGAAPSQSGGTPSKGPRMHTFQRILVTAYSSGPADPTTGPRLTATSTEAQPGTIALSRDLLRTFTPDGPFDFGDKVMIPGVGIFEVRDTMHPRWTEKADIWVTSPEKAMAWGCRAVFVTKVAEDAPTMACRQISRSLQAASDPE